MGFHGILQNLSGLYRDDLLKTELIVVTLMPSGRNKPAEGENDPEKTTSSIMQLLF